MLTKFLTMHKYTFPPIMIVLGTNALFGSLLMPTEKKQETHVKIYIQVNECILQVQLNKLEYCGKIIGVKSEIHIF